MEQCDLIDTLHCYYCFYSLTCEVFRMSRQVSSTAMEWRLLNSVSLGLSGVLDCCRPKCIMVEPGPLAAAAERSVGDQLPSCSPERPNPLSVEASTRKMLRLSGGDIFSKPYDLRRRCHSLELVSFGRWRVSKLCVLWTARKAEGDAGVGTGSGVCRTSTTAGLATAWCARKSSLYRLSSESFFSLPRISCSDSAVRNVPRLANCGLLEVSDAADDRLLPLLLLLELEFSILSNAAKSTWLLRMAVFRRRPFSSSARMRATLTELLGKSNGRGRGRVHEVVPLW